MSGIFGLFTGKNNIDNNLDVSSMFSWNRFYGGNGEGTYERENFALGCCVQLLSGRHVQSSPVLHEKERHAVIDAVIYNRDELLAKYDCAEEMSDPELLFVLTGSFGMECLAEVNGDFAGAVIDEKVKTLTLFRDHMGIRPLYYYADKEAAAFSTDLRGLLAAPNINHSISEEWIYKTVAGYDADNNDNTPYEGVCCVTPAHYTVISFAGGSFEIESHRYWKLGSSKIRFSSDSEYIQKLRELVEDSVRRRLDVVSGIVGAELSGGLDSSVIDILINRQGREAIYYSWSLDPDELQLADNDERHIIADICRQENITCHYMHMSSDFTVKAVQSMEKAGLGTPSDGSIDFRFALPANSNTYTLLHGSFFVREKGAKVMFTGHGGDEGISHRSDVYEMFYHHEYYHYWKYIWSVTRRGHRVLRTLKRGIRNIISSNKASKEVYTNWYASPELLKTDFASDYKNTKQPVMPFSYDPVAYIEGGGSRNRLENMALLGAYSGIRYMVPYLDYRVIDFAVSIPRYLYLKGGTKRYIFREAFRDIMPASLYELNNKEETSINNLKSDDEWFEGYNIRKREVIDTLDRDYWSKYLDFEKIDELYHKGKPSEEEYFEETKQIKALLKCALAQNVIDRAKDC